MGGLASAWRGSCTRPLAFLLALLPGLLAPTPALAQTLFGPQSYTQTTASPQTFGATFPLVASASGGPIYAGGEEVRWARVAATFGGGSTVTYITASGKGVSAASLTSGTERD